MVTDFRINSSPYKKLKSQENEKINEIQDLKSHFETI